MLDELLNNNGILHDYHEREWLDACELLLEDHSVSEVEGAIRFCQRDPFWRDKVRSLPYLRLKFSELHRQANRGRQRPGSRALDPEEIERRVAHYRRNIEGGEVFGESYLLDFHEEGYDGPSEVDRLCDEYRGKLEGRR